MNSTNKRLFFSKNSAFVHTLTTLLVMFLLVLSVFVGIIGYLLNHMQKQQTQQTNQQVLEQTMEMAEVSLNILLSEVNQIQWNEQVVSYLIRSRKEDTQREMSIIQILQSTVQENQLISSLWIYDHSRERILNHDGFIGAPGDFANGPLLSEDYTPSVTPSYPTRPEAGARLLLWDSRLFWVKDLVLTDYVGSICMEIDLRYLYETLRLSDYPEKMYLYWKDGQLIAPRHTKDEISPRIKDSLFQAKDTILTEHGWYVTGSSDLDLYLVREDSPAMESFPLSVLPIAIPSLLLFVFMGVFGTWLITRKIYAPINQLIGTILHYQNKSIPDNENELSYLRLSFFETMDETKALRQSMDFFRNDILEQVFHRILQGYSPKDAGVGQFHPDWSHQWMEANQYQILGCCLQAVETDDSSWNIKASAQLIRNLLSSMEHSPEVLVISMEENLLALVIAGHESTDLLFQKVTQTLEQKILDTFGANVLFRITMAHGRIYHAPEDLLYSWQEAKDRLRYLAYLEKSEKPAAARELVPSNEAAETNREEYFRNRVQQILDHVTQARKDEAIKLMNRIIDEILTETPTVQQSEQLEQLKNIFLEKCLTISGRDDLESWDDFPDSDTDSDTGTFMKEVMQRQIEQIWNVTQKRSYRYVETALRYIQENCHDSNLSAQMVAEYLHINSSYFSEIFNGQVRESFSSYLNRIRVEHSQKLLRETDLAIRDVGFRCGFSTVQHFNRMFKKYSGLTPKQYRDSQN